jgi:hypothetical protein
MDLITSIIALVYFIILSLIIFKVARENKQLKSEVSHQEETISVLQMQTERQTQTITEGLAENKQLKKQLKEHEEHDKLRY